VSRFVRQWAEFRRRQRAALEASLHSAHAGADVRPEPTPADVLLDATGARPEDDAAEPPGPALPLGDDDDPEAFERPAHGVRTRFGVAGKPLNRTSPFYMGFVGASGAIIAIGLWHSLGRLATTLTILVVALFLSLSLNPLVEGLIRRGMRRAPAVALVFAGLLVVFGLVGLVVVPPVVRQAGDLTQAAPDYIQKTVSLDWVQRLDRDYQVLDKLQAEATKRIQDPNFLSQIFGGVLGAGRVLASFLFQTFTVLVLTLYLLVSLPRVKQAAYRIVPATRRTRFVSLSEEIQRRVGSYALGQLGIASLNAFLSWLMMLIVGIPYAAVLAVAVGFLGLVPMVGATLGAAVVCAVAAFDEPRKALIAAIYYLVYQQVENYVVAPRVMQRTVAVPGAVTVVAALAGGTLLGILGALLAIPVAAGLLLLYEEVLVPRQTKH
jgi:predicted PurR-regulated permease PerM